MMMLQSLLNQLQRVFDTANAGQKTTFFMLFATVILSLFMLMVWGSRPA